MPAPTMLTTLADVNDAANIMHSFVAPIMATLCVVASLVSVLFLILGGYHYMTSAGRPDNLEQAKRTIRNALIGLVIVLGAGVLTAILSHAYGGTAATAHSQLPNLNAVNPAPVSNGLVSILIKAVTGLLNNIIQSVAAPFLKALSFFTTSTPLMASNPSVFKLWAGMVGIADSLFVLVVALLGFHVMSFASVGLDEIEFKHLIPKLAAIFLLVNISIFAIDGVIELSNVMIHAINAVGGSGSVWEVLTKVVKQSGGLGVAALLIMVVFVIFAVILLVYYVGRLVTLYIGAVLAPVVLLLWLVPGFRDFSESAGKVYLTTIFVLFVHVVILQLAASLFTGIQAGTGSGHTPDTLMAMVVGLATLVALLKTQGVLMQLSYVSTGPRTARKLGGQFINGISYVAVKSRTAGAAVSGTSSAKQSSSGGRTIITAPSGKRSQSPGATYTQPKTRKNTSNAGISRAKTGETTVAPTLNEAKPPKNKEKP